MNPTEKRQSLRNILESKEVTVLPGGMSPLYARMVEEIGFECFYLAGSQMGGILFGLPNIAVIGASEVAEHVRRTTALTNIPIIVDADTGYGNALTAFLAVQQYINAGGAAVSLEDSEVPKRYAAKTPGGKRVVSISEAVGRYQAAAAARDELDSSAVLIARTHTISAENSSFDDTLKRCVAYVDDGGANCIWLGGHEDNVSLAQIAQLCSIVAVPVICASRVSKDIEPTLEEFEELGVRGVLYPTAAGSVGTQAIWEYFNALKQDGSRAAMEYRGQVANSRFGEVPNRALLNYEYLRDIENRYIPDEL